ncbi:Protein F55B11.1 [Aphelenchoides avenae]|nr:Protein F55B11.1 [Aphelenchus avenae]
MPSHQSAADESLQEFSFDTDVLVFYVNGKRIEEKSVDPRTTLAAYLRENLHLTGTKIGCNEGGCGACTVMISDVDPNTEEVRHYSANACLTPVCAVFGKAVTTVEGIGSVARKRLHPVQERLSIAHGSQCGFCTPGFVMAMYTLLRNNPQPSQADIDESLQGNLCRCTGYRPILEAYYSFIPKEDGTAKASKDAGCGMGDQCCKLKNADSGGSGNGACSSGYASEDAGNGNHSPAKVARQLGPCSIAKHDGTLERGPVSIEHLTRIKKLHPHTRIIAGNSEVAVELKFRFIELPVALNPKQIPELRQCFLDDEKGAFVGVGLSLTETKAKLNEYISQLPVQKTAVFRSVCAMLHYFAGKHVRNMADTQDANTLTRLKVSTELGFWKFQ